MRLFVSAVGFLGGVVVGVLLLLFNPLATGAQMPPLDGDVVATKPFKNQAYRGTEISLGALLGLGGGNVSTTLQDPTITNTRASVVLLDPADELPAGLGVKLVYYSKENSLLRGRLGMTSLWGVVWPGSGSIFLAGQENYWPLLSEAAWSALGGNGFVLKADQYPLSLRGAPTVALGAVGANGQYARAAGQFRESALPVNGRADQLNGQLQIQLKSE